MSHDSHVMKAVLSGRVPERAHFDDYFRAFHDQYASATESALDGFVDERGVSSYERLAQAVPLAPSSRVLDVGCGDGALLERIARRVPPAHLNGIDLAPVEIERARARLSAHTVDALTVGDACAMPFASDSFDAVVSHLAVMLVPDAERLIAEVRRVLRAGGTFGFLIPRPPEPDNEITALLGAIVAWAREQHPDFAPINPGDPRMFSPPALTQLLAQHGLPHVEYVDFTVKRTVPLRELPAILRRRYYLGSLSEDLWQQIASRIDRWGDGRDAVIYSEALRLVISR